MILIRDIFQLKFGTAKEAKALWKDGFAILRKAGFPDIRILTDMTGTYYTFVLESQHKSLSDYEESAKREADSTEWRAWYPKFAALVETGRREIFSIVDL